MRRISLALALIGAAAATGCGQTSTSNTGGDRGVAEGTFNVTVQNGQNGNTSLAITGGWVTSTPAGIDCGIAPHTACSADFAVETAPGVLNVVKLVATAADPGVPFFGFAGDCKGISCELSGAADKYILAQFSTTGGGHPIEWGNPYTHVGMYLSDAFNCQGCHGAELLGGLSAAPSCAKCHSWPYSAAIVDSFAGVTDPYVEPPAPVGPAAWDNVIGKHFQATGHNSGACARCHTGSGFKDYIGADGTADNHLAGYVNPPNAQNAAALNVTVACTAGTTVPCISNGFTCTTCHNATTALGGGTLSDVVFPQYSGVSKTVTVDPGAAICGQCHTGIRDGRNIATLGAVLGTPTFWDSQLAASNATIRPHYLGALSTFLGEDAGVLAQYTGAVYTARNEHGGLTNCATCHDAHTGNIVADIRGACGSCHFNEGGAAVADFVELEEVRQFGFEGDIDADGNPTESLKDEVAGLKAKLAAAISSYSTQISGTGICFQANPNGLVDDARILRDAGVACGTAPNNSAYNKYTPRLLKAVFNYMTISNDLGSWAHNPRYAIEIVYDSIADLNLGLIAQGFTAMPNGNRAFNGHFGALEDPSPYAAMLYHGGTPPAGMTDLIPPMGFTSGACYQCHGGKGGVDAYLATAPLPLTAAVMTDANKVTALQCSVCHALDGVDMKGLRTGVATVWFPAQKDPAAVPNPAPVSFAAASLPSAWPVCGTCHGGRENGQSITNKINTAPVSGPGIFNKSVTNPHYLGAAAMILGNDGKMMYQYGTNTYAGKTVFWNAATNGNAPGPYGSPHGANCTGCHQPKASKHEFGVDFASCATCHTGQYALAPVEEEFVAARAELLTAIRAYATANKAALATATAQPDFQTVCYNNNAHPYFYIETSAGCQSGSTYQFTKCDSKLLAATFNYLWTTKELGAWAHNEVYVFQVMYDAIVDLGGTPTFARP